MTNYSFFSLYFYVWTERNYKFDERRRKLGKAKCLSQARCILGIESASSHFDSDPINSGGLIFKEIGTKPDEV